MAVDSKGKLDCGKLREELVSALEQDDRRNKVDAMKKRAILSASSYDEFRHMVDCAHLKTVSRSELDSLSDEKRGWAKSKGISGSSKPSSGAPVARTRRKSKKEGILKPTRAPTSQSEFERDWRRLKTEEDKRRYLHLIPVERIPALFRVGLDPMLLGQLLTSLALALRAAESDVKGRDVQDSGAPSFGDELADNEGSSAQMLAFSDWLFALTSTGRFSLGVSFLKAEEKKLMETMIDSLNLPQEAHDSLINSFEIVKS